MAKKPTQNEPCLWERQPNESEQAWQAFLVFRNLGENRSVHAVCEELSKSRQLISRWKSTWFWDDRVLAYDNSLQREAYKEAKKEQRNMSKRHITISQHLQKFAMDALAEKKPEEASVKDIKELLKVATELERLTRANLVASYEIEVTAEEEKDDVVIYVPDNGMEVDGE